MKLSDCAEVRVVGIRCGVLSCGLPESRRQTGGKKSHEIDPSIAPQAVRFAVNKVSLKVSRRPEIAKIDRR